MLDIGDIAVRMQRQEDVVDVYRCSFRDGYFIILSVFQSETRGEIIDVCKIMNELGETSWIAASKLRVVSKL